MSGLKADQSGFTLLELMLAMSLFLTVLMLTTSGFIALNRTYTRGTVRRQLSEAVQTSTESLTKALRSAPANSTAVTLCSTAVPNCTPQDASNALSFNSACYFWNNSANQALRGGLYVSSNKCEAGSDLSTKARLLADKRYLVQKLTINPVSGNNGLWQIDGIIRTVDDNSFNNPGLDEVRCKGSTQSAFVQVCAVESFKFIVNNRGGSQQ